MPESNFFARFNIGGKNKPVATGTTANQNQNINQNQSINQGKQTQQGANTGIDGMNDPNNKTDPTKNSVKTAKSPLDDFSTLFDNPNTDDKQNLPPSLSISPDKLKEHVSKLDFTADLPNETRQALVNMGDQGKLFLELLNHVGRQAYSTAVQHSSALTDKFVGMRSEFDTKALSGRVKSELVRSGFHKSNAHPVVKAAQEMVASQLQAVNPDATPEWIQEQTNSFFTLLGQQLDPNANKGEGNTDDQRDGDVNWLEFAGAKPASKQVA